MCTVLHAIVAAALPLLAGSSRSQMPFFWNDLVWSAAIGLVLAALAPALPNQFAQTVPSGPTSSIARSATLKRRPASSIMYIFPYAIVTIALSHLAGSSPPAPRPCMHVGLGHPGPGQGRSVCRYRRSSRAGLCADASEPARGDLCKDRLNDGPQVEVPDADATLLILCHPRGARPAAHAMRACRLTAHRRQHSNGRDYLDR
jgi:hypothetical protein